MQNLELRNEDERVVRWHTYTMIKILCLMGLRRQYLLPSRTRVGSICAVSTQHDQTQKWRVAAAINWLVEFRNEITYYLIW